MINLEYTVHAIKKEIKKWNNSNKKQSIGQGAAIEKLRRSYLAPRSKPGSLNGTETIGRYKIQTKESKYTYGTKNGVDWVQYPVNALTKQQGLCDSTIFFVQ